MKPGTRFAALFVITVGCSSSNFEVGTDGTETGPVEDVATSDTTPADGGNGDTEQPADGNSTGDAIVADSGCAFATNPAEIWVDATSMVKAEAGTTACPFRHVLDAVNYANMLGGNRTIRVAAGIYAEGAAIILRPGLTLTGSGVGVTQLEGGGPCTTSTTGYKCVVRVDAGAILERVTINSAPNGKHGVVTGEAEGSFPIVRSTAIYAAGGSCCSAILVTNGAILGPNIEATNSARGLDIWGNQGVKVLAGSRNKFDNNSIVGINNASTGALTFEGGSVSNNAAGIKLGEPTVTPPPVNFINNLIATNNAEYGIRVAGVASAKIRNSTITGSKVGVIAIHGVNNIIDLGTSSSPGGNNFGGSVVKNSLAGICALFTRSSALEAVGNTFPACTTPRSLDEISVSAGCEAITSYADVWFRGATPPVTTSCAIGM